MTTIRTIQDAAAETGVSRDTLRYYERVGILPGIARSQSGHRRFTDDDMGWINLVRCLRATGMPIQDLHAYVELVKAGDHTAEQRLELLKAHRRRILADLDGLASTLALVDQKISGYTQLVADRVPAIPVDGSRPRPRRVRIRTAG